MSDHEVDEAANAIQPKTESSASQNPEEDNKGEEMLSLKVTDSQTDVAFKVKMKTPLKRVIDAFCKRTGKDRNSLRFIFDGERIHDEDTPASIGMEDGDFIEALNQQTGGC
ncbi:SUMO family protein [Starmerella bacillaris]|uniref:SUMO family protein n=1 Tax=Starmerella bacillaris TaxID=1247836 RepID=A0AAV5RGX8_STABA|nr:SUMO family protein [Starmerella bacillaris]